MGKHGLDPFDAATARPYLEGLAARARAGACEEELRSELFATLWPWGLRHARSSAVRTPEGADRAEVASNLLFALYRACHAIDWDQWQAWPTFLATSLRGARIDAARSDDALSRRQRVARTAFQQAREAAVQAAGRQISAKEEREVLSSVAPAAAADPYHALLITADVRREPIDGVEVPAHGTDPAALVISSITAEAVRAWILHDLPPRVRGEVMRWLQQQRLREQLPQRTRAHLAPYLPLLLRRVSDRDDTASRRAG